MVKREPQITLSMRVEAMFILLLLHKPNTDHRQNYEESCPGKYR